MKNYTAVGTPISPMITELSNPTGVAVYRSGNIYVANDGNNTVTTYAPGERRTTQ